MIRLKRDVYDQVISHAKKDSPVEACGYLGSSGGIIVEGFPMENIDRSPQHFSFDPKEQFAVLNKAKAKGLKLTAVYHSHPSTPARPSEEDIRIAYDPAISYIIVSLAGNEPVLKSYRISRGQVENEDAEITE
ncbi:MAG: M67 family metallopeptidase [Brevinematales bacterium]|jgi:proteasome lid subunit RPN8/RPN11